MALALSIALSNISDCGTIYLTDVTGLFDASINPNGYGTPNTTLANIASASITSIVYYPPGGAPSQAFPLSGSPVSIFPTTANPSPFILNESYSLTPAMFGLSQSTWADGIYVITYDVTDTSAVVTSVTAQYEFICNSQCCLDNKLVNVCFCGDCNCDDTDLLFFNWMGLRASEAAAACLKNGETLDIIQCVSDWCAEDDCGCGPK